MNSEKCALTLGIQGGRNIFVLADLSAEQLSPYDMLPRPDASFSNSEDWEVAIEVYRKGALFSEGRIKYLGGHDGSHHIYGLHEVWPDGATYQGEGPFFGHNLLASRFTLGDIIVLGVLLEYVRENILYRKI